MTFKRPIMVGMILMLLVTLPFSGSEASAAAGPEGSVRNGRTTAPQMNIALTEGLLYLDLREAEIGAVLRVIAEKAGIGLAVGDSVRGNVSLKLEGVSLEEALRRLCESRAILYEYDPQTRTGRIIGAGAFAASSEPSAGSRSDAAVPVPASLAKVGRNPKKSTVEAVGELPPPQGGLLSGKGDGERRYDSQGRPLYKPRELLVRFRPEATAEQISALHQNLGSTVLKSLDNIKLHRVRLREGLPEREGVALYVASEIVAAAEKHALRYPLLTPNDDYYKDGLQWGLNKIQMPAAWEKTTGSPNIVVGVIDTGVDTDHPDLSANLLPGRDLAGAVRSNPTDSDADPMDIDGHGTHVAGIIAAVGNNGEGVAGVGWNLRIMPLKVLADNSPNRDMEIFDIVAAIDYAIAQRVQLVNCSFGGGGGPSQEEYNAFSRLGLAGILAVCSAGNSNANNDTDALHRMYPASYDLDNIISVAESDQTDNLWASSSYGKTSVDLMAPGVSIYSTCLNSSYCVKEGTSMAAPHVTGVAGLILSRNPHLVYARVKSVILESVDPVPTVADKLSSGGRLNAAKALSQTCLPGAVTWSDPIGLSDVIAALRIGSGMDVGVPICRTADVDGDDRIGLAEAIYGLQLLSGIRVE